jgi:uncharacterized protein (TIGR04255 family)
VARLVPDETNFGDSAPATEALVDIRVDGSVENSALAELSAELAGTYPIEHPLIEWTGTLKDDEEAVMENRVVRGFLRRNDDTRSVVQLRRDGFTFSKLHPYTSWEQIRAIAREHWERYAAVAKPTKVVRLAVRYINHLRPPSGWTTSTDWLSIHATSARLPGGSDTPQDFFVRILERHPRQPYMATVTVATVQDSPGQRALLFDIDTACENEFAADDSAVWSVLDNLRDFKNDIFFSSITSKTRELLDATNG